MDDSWIPQTSDEWFNWLSEEETKTCKAYFAKPANLISDYRNELATTRDYEGREILELLQNAADQAQEAKVQGQVLIELLPEGLVIANNGAPFSIGGVLSLENAYLSPKRHKRRQLIGNKGLGFRSVLNWTHSPMILSGALGLAYSQKVSRAKLDELTKNSSSIAELVTREANGSNTLVMPVLPFPGYNRDGCIDSYISNKGSLLLLKHCKRLRENGYTTAIGMPFDEPIFFNDAQEQIKALRPEILLFTNHIDEVRFIIDEDDERVWSKQGDDTASMVLDNQEPLGIWQVIRTHGQIPEDQLDKDQRGPLNYELIVAVPEVETLDELKVSPLFSHFPTRITLPLPVVCHATLELNQSRNQINQCRSNRYVLEQLANFLVKVAEKRAAQHPTGPKAGFRILMAQEAYPFDLKDAKFSFSKHLLESAAKGAIVPTLDGRAVLPECALCLPGADNTWLPASRFAEVVPVSNKTEYDFFRALGVEELKINIFRQRLLSISNLSRAQRLCLISGMIKNQIPIYAHSSSLLLGSHARPIPDNAVVFIAPQGSTIPELPNWVTLWFLDNDFRLDLMKTLDVKEVRELQGKLSTFGLLEYSFARLINRLVTAANQYKSEHLELAVNVDQELLKTVFGLYRTEGNLGNRPAFPEKNSLELPTQGGKKSAAGSLYMGRGYGTQGNIVQALYEGWAPERLLVEPKALKLTDENIQLEDFLKWLGVNTWPKDKIKNNSDHSYKKHVLDNIPYPAKFEEYVFQSRSEIKRSSIDLVKTVDGLEEILECADPAAIIAWLALDERSLNWSRRNNNLANLTALRGNDYKPRIYKEGVPGYVRWKLETTEWLLDKDGQRLRPKDCVLGERAIETLFPRPAHPGRKLIEKYGISESDLIEGWRRSGVLTSLAELKLNDLYARLLEMPDQHPDGKAARSLYRWLLDAADVALGEGGNARESFFRTGRMWGHRGNDVGYYPISELYHVDSEGLPTALLSRLKIVDLPHRIGADKVKRVFGIEPIDRMSIKQKLKSYSLSRDLDTEFQKAKPFLYRLRVSQASQTLHLNTLKQLTLKICSELCAEMEYDGEKIDFDLPIWGWLIDNGTLYIRSDPTEVIDSSSDLLADAIGAAIASIYRIGDGGEFARMFLCRQKDRRALLRRMRGEAADEDMDRIIEEFGQPTPADRLVMLPDVGPIAEPERIGPHGVEADVDQAKETEPEQDNPAGTLADKNDLSIRQVEHNQNPSPIKQKMRIKLKSGKHPEHTTTNHTIDPDFIERKVMEIEESFQPSRYPLRVGHLTGFDAPGCDILSFNSADHRDKFLSGEDRDMRNILRFIEVKGRKKEDAKIELRGNEKDAAVKYRDRYYLYRLYKFGENDYILSILQNPLSSDEALEASIYVDIGRAKRTEQFEISGGMLPNE